MTEVSRSKVGKVKTGRMALSAGLREAAQERQQPKDDLEKVEPPKEKVDPLAFLDSDEEDDPLCAACSGSKLNAVRRALAAGSDPNVVGNQGTTPLFMTCQEGKEEMVAMLLAAKADPCQKCFGGATPLFIACSRNRPEVVTLLARAGAPLEECVNGFYTPMLTCVTHGCEQAARALLAANASVATTSPQWGSLLHAAAKTGKCVDTLRMLIAAGADLDAVHEGATPLQLAEQRGNAEAALALRQAEARKQRLKKAHLPKGLRGGQTSAPPAVDVTDADGGAAAGTEPAPPAEAPPPTAEEAAAAAAADELRRAAKAEKRARQRARKKEEARQAERAEALSRDTEDARRADQVLAGRAIAALSVDAAKAVAQAAAVEEVAAAVRQEEERRKLRALGDAARRKAIEDGGASDDEPALSGRVSPA